MDDGGAECTEAASQPADEAHADDQERTKRRVVVCREDRAAKPGARIEHGISRGFVETRRTDRDWKRRRNYGNGSNGLARLRRGNGNSERVRERDSTGERRGSGRWFGRRLSYSNRGT